MELENLLSLDIFCDHYRIDPTFIESLNDLEIIELISVNGETYLHHDSLEKTEKIIRLHLDLSINLEGIDVILQLLDKIDNLENELAAVKNDLKA